MVIVVMDYDYLQFSALALGTSVIITIRTLMNLTPWTDQMEMFTGISKADVEVCVKSLKERFENDFHCDSIMNLDAFEEKEKLFIDQQSKFAKAFSLKGHTLLENNKDYFLNERHFDFSSV